MRAVLATRSSGKLRELRPMFADAGWDVVSLDELGVPVNSVEDDVESFETFEENALAKADYFFRTLAMPAIADDSGLEVFALGGAPGVRSKRWSGRADLSGQALDDANNAKLMAALRDAGDLRARYVCAAAFVDGARRVVVRGESTGRIVRDPRGREGFGYDPYFVSDELGRTFGESAVAEKERVSHRGRAFRALLERLGTSS